MSSRSFRLRNNRRRHKPGAGPDGQQQKPEGERENPPLGARPPRQGVSARGQRRDGRVGGKGPSGAPASDSRPAWPEMPLVFPDCPICGKPVRDLPSALTHKITRKPAHFDCIMRELSDSNEVAPQERICYLGGGSFGILEFKPPGGPIKFVIRKRIPYEEKETPQEWKKTLQVPC
jgi:hypothetical protein